MSLDDMNIYLARVEKAYTRIKDIYDKKIEYTPDDYPMLVNTMERLYKGYCFELKKMFPDDRVFSNMSEHDFNATHRITPFAQKVNAKLPLSASKEGYHVIIERLTEISNRYTPSRFEKEFSFEDFASDARRFFYQKERLQNELTSLQNELQFDKEEAEYWK